jgi:hypothetical protein
LIDLWGPLYNRYMGRTQKYPWDEWCDGEEHTITQGPDFDVTPQSMRTTLHGKCHGEPMWVETKIIYGRWNKVTFRFHKEWQDGDKDDRSTETA